MTRQRHWAWRFGPLVLLQFALLLIGLRFFAPALWARQLAAGPWAIVIVFLATHLFTCFFEWGFHRYVLHSVTLGWLRKLTHAHRNHHALTNIQLAPDAAGPGRIVLNRYPIVEDEQFEDAMFPDYALVAFWLLFTPPLVLVQLLLPRAPVLLGGYAAVTWAMASYEILHGIEHLPYRWWQRATTQRHFGGMWRAIYGFHHFHHANVGSNEAISGFFGLPVADWVFRTYSQPKELLLHGRVATARDFAVRPPLPFVVWLDRWARARESRISRKPPGGVPAT